MSNLLNKFVDLYENTKLSTIALIAAGFLMHLTQTTFGIVPTSTFSELLPNTTSCIVTFSVIYIYIKIRALWVTQLKDTKWNALLKILVYALEVLALVFIVDVSIYNFWIPFMKYLKYANFNIGRYIMSVSEDGIQLKVAYFSKWIYYNGYDALRFFFALLILATALCMSGIVSILNNFINSNNENRDSTAIVHQNNLNEIYNTTNFTNGLSVRNSSLETSC